MAIQAVTMSSVPIDSAGGSDKHTPQAYMPPWHPRCPVVLKDESEAQGSKGVAAESNIKAIPKVPTSSWFWSPTHKTRKKTPL
ncbi:hypothetical protein Pst134EA_030334 [Puccinia striiformis f. sp. tritici]|uniref:hypothetical protein n=1 Tax=Puccinia striiformis f. sp. tritici TaxID=168172 RepID=UPI002008A879|nr:hypothetical protein Pst134EA_030334 [Puccinia striiformis f. sp. tritici]KAH9446415.1 hypothetical protein Pst134EA_030334 [Puccinia striiformis f. sp. tritici]